MGKCKVLLVVLLVLQSITVFGKDKITKVIGDDARTILEALVASNVSELANVTEDWDLKAMTVSAAKIECSYSAIFPDELMFDASCTAEREDESLPEIKNDLALLRALKKYAAFDAGLSKRTFSVLEVYCMLDYKVKSYECTLATKED